MQRDEHDHEPDELPDRAPEGDAAPRDDVRLAQGLALDPEEARRLDEAPEEQVDEPAEGRHLDHRQEQGVAEVELLVEVEPHEDDGRGQDRDGRGRPRERPPLAAPVCVVRPVQRGGADRLGRHSQTLVGAVRAGHVVAELSTGAGFRPDAGSMSP